MPIRREHRFFYPIDWPQLSAAIRFGRAGGACEGCGRPHGLTVYHLGDGRWWDASIGAWRDGQGRKLRSLPTIEDLGRIRTTRVVLAAAHRDHDTTNNQDRNLAAFCQRCHSASTTIAPSIGVDAGAPCSTVGRWGTCFGGSTRPRTNRAEAPISAPCPAGRPVEVA